MVYFAPLAMRNPIVLSGIIRPMRDADRRYRPATGLGQPHAVFSQLGDLVSHCGAAGIRPALVVAPQLAEARRPVCAITAR
jgi:hypothetical protein